ncbi:VWA domain-containing protein [Glaciecola sp. 2405UD65-10]|uniref:vWA domain-containing protein n=1 Tax=Glaciecola sp. 2405UD65-10 TaxID=3397244 RepID=UPI003B590600
MDALYQFIENFQFSRPAFLLAIIPLVVVCVLKLKFGQNQNAWQQLLPKHLYQNLIISKGLGRSNRFVHAALTGWIIAILALAGPAWEKLPQAVYQTQAGKVLLMDMSMSMRATDLSPNRLTRARFKAIDLIKQLKEGETGLIAYAGDAFVVSPLTDDSNTLSNLIPSLSPDIMPTQGSSALTGLQRSSELLESAGYKSGDIYWITDGIRYDELNDIREFILQSAFNVSALLVGTEEGAPIQLIDGKLMKDYTGSIVVPSINERYLKQATQGTKASYSLFASDNSDIDKIKRALNFEQQRQAEKVEDTQGDTLKDMGPFLVLLLLPFAAYAFRKGIMVLGLVSVLSGLSLSGLYSAPSYAQEVDAQALQEPKNKISMVDSVFKNADQKGKLAFDAQNYEQASKLFEDPQWRAASAYKKGDYETAASIYEQLPGLENTYNLANALAKQGQLEEAIDAYNKVLEQQANNAQALQNKAIVEELLKQQEQQEQQDQNQQGDNQEQNQENNQEQSDEQNQQQEGNQEDADGEQQDKQQEQDEQSQSSDESQEQGDSQNQQQQDDRSLEDEAQKPGNEEQEQQEQGQSEPESNSEENPGSNENQAPQTEQTSEQEQQQAIDNSQFKMENLSPEEQEEMQRLQMILNKVPDDPAYLLQRKMLLEAHRRKNTPAPPTHENW